MTDDDTLISFDRVEMVYPARGAGGEHAALSGVSFGLRRGSRLAVIGESGSGKSTIARIALGILRRTGGELSVLGADWNLLSARQRSAARAKVGAVFQDPIESLNPLMSTATLIAEPLRIHRPSLARDDIDSLVRQAMNRARVPVELWHRRPGQMSGGQAQRVSIARALVNDPELLVLDEPTSALDVSVQARVLALLDDLHHESQLSWLFVTHDLGVARRVCDDVLVLYRGRVVEAGPVETVFHHPQHAYTRTLIAAGV